MIGLCIQPYSTWLRSIPWTNADGANNIYINLHDRNPPTQSLLFVTPASTPHIQSQNTTSHTPHTVLSHRPITPPSTPRLQLALMNPSSSNTKPIAIPAARIHHMLVLHLLRSPPCGYMHQTHPLRGSHVYTHCPAHGCCRALVIADSVGMSRMRGDENCLRSV